MEAIPYGRQDISQDDIDAVVEVLKSDFLTQGPAVPRFEQLVATYCHVKHAVAVNSATSALHIACLALGLMPGDVLWTSPISFVASANCGLYCGAIVDFVDIDAETYNMCPVALERKLLEAEKCGKLPKVVVPVHLCGQPCNMEAIHALSQRFGFNVIEDGSHAIGARYKGEPIGNCRYSDITIFSFHPVKIITTGEGGMALTKRDDLAHKMTLLRSHAITRDQSEMTHEPDGPWYYQQVGLGYNYRMTEMQGALGASQMSRLDTYVLRRHDLARRYDESSASLRIKTPWQHPDSYSGLHLYVIRLKLSEIRCTHLQVFEALRNRGIGVNLHYIPIYRQPYFRKMGFKAREFPQAEKYYAEAISLPMYPGLSAASQDRVIEILTELCA
jgi:UDP-4-amino-4,6-dideoxy-N-acetyl-beta-L-altrosamine transaminase